MEINGFRFKNLCLEELIMILKIDLMRASENIRLLKSIWKQMIKKEKRARKNTTGDNITS
jgi:predicted nucleotidyltransferase